MLMRIFSLVVIFIFTGSFTTQAKPVRTDQVQDVQDWRMKQRFWGETTKVDTKKEINTEAEKVVIKEREDEKSEEASLAKNDNNSA